MHLLFCEACGRLVQVTLAHGNDLLLQSAALGGQHDALDTRIGLVGHALEQLLLLQASQGARQDAFLEVHALGQHVLGDIVAKTELHQHLVFGESHAVGLQINQQARPQGFYGAVQEVADVLIESTHPCLLSQIKTRAGWPRSECGQETVGRAIVATTTRL